MAIYSQSVKVISRGSGRSAVAAAAYRAGERITSQRNGTTYDYRPIERRVVHSEIMLPEHAPKAYADRATLWNEVERVEKAKNSQLSREVMLALPIEFNQETNIQLVRDYAQKQYVDNGMIADINVHDSGDGNPHVHIMLTMRSIDNNGYWMDKKKKIYVLDKNGNKQRIGNTKNYVCTTHSVNNWNSKDFLNESREAWANHLNDALQARGFDVRVDHRSYEKQGIDKAPTVHMGVKCSEMEKRGIRTERGEYNREIIKMNEAKERYYSAVHEDRAESPIYKQEQETIKQLADKSNRQDNIIDFCKTKMVDELNKAVADRMPESARDEIIKTWRERISYAETEKVQAGQEITKTRRTMFPEYSHSRAELEKVRNKTPEDEKAIHALTARVDAAEKITFKELRDASNAYTQAQKEYASASYKLQFVPDDKVKGAIAEIEASKANTDACKAELSRVKTLFIMDERESMHQGTEREDVKQAEPMQPEPVTMLSKEEASAALNKRDWSLDELKHIPQADIKAAVEKVQEEYYALTVTRDEMEKRSDVKISENKAIKAIEGKIEEKRLEMIEKIAMGKDQRVFDAEDSSMLSKEEASAALNKRDWSLDELKHIPKEEIKAAVHKVKAEYYALLVKQERMQRAVLDMQSNTKSKYTYLNMAYVTATNHKNLKTDLIKYDTKREELRLKLENMSGFDKMVGKHFDVKKDIAMCDKRYNEISEAVKNYEKEFFDRYGIDISKTDADRWIWKQKRLIDEKYLLTKAAKISENKDTIVKVNEKRLEAIEKIALAKDLNVLDAEDHSLREVMVEAGCKPDHVERSHDMLRNVSKKDQREIAERKDKNNQPKEKSAIQNAVKAQQAVVKALQKGIEIGEDNAR